MQTFMKTATIDAGKFTNLTADTIASIGAISGTTISGTTITGTGFTKTGGTSAGAWPANIRLADINTGSLASATTNGHWNNLTLAAGASAPATNISLQHLKQIGASFTATTSFLYVNNFNSQSPIPGSAASCINILTPTTITGDGGNNIQFYILGQTSSLSSYGGGTHQFGVFVIMGSFCNTATVGSTFHAPHFVFFGSNAAGTNLAMNSTVRGYNLADA